MSLCHCFLPPDACNHVGGDLKVLLACAGAATAHVAAWVPSWKPLLRQPAQRLWRPAAVSAAAGHAGLIPPPAGVSCDTLHCIMEVDCIAVGRIAAVACIVVKESTISAACSSALPGALLRQQCDVCFSVSQVALSCAGSFNRLPYGYIEPQPGNRLRDHDDRCEHI